MRGLYAIVDVDVIARGVPSAARSGALAARAFSPVEFAEAVLDAKPAGIQLRDKSRGARATLETLRSIVKLAARAGVPSYANDRPDLALLAGADGVHLGQDDVPIGAARSVADLARRALKIGLSTHDEAQAVAAADEGPDYLAVGPVRATSSKANPDPVLGVARAKSIATRVRARSSRLPIVAIGGIDHEAAVELADAFDCVAVIGALASLPTLAEVAARAKEISAAFTAKKSIGRSG